MHPTCLRYGVMIPMSESLGANVELSVSDCTYVTTWELGREGEGKEGRERSRQTDRQTAGSVRRQRLSSPPPPPGHLQHLHGVEPGGAAPFPHVLPYHAMEHKGEAFMGKPLPLT